MTTTIFTNVRLFDGVNITTDCHVEIRNGIITSVTRQPIIKSADAQSTTVIDGTGKTLLPGLIEGHMHAHPPSGQGSEILKPAIACGVTTCCDLHNDPETVKRLKADCAASASLPDFKSSCYAATVDGGWPKPILLHIDSSEEGKKRVAQLPSVALDTAEEYIRSTKASGADYIKLMQEDGTQGGFKDVPAASIELQTKLTATAHEHGMLVLAHATTVDATRTVLAAGADGVAHALRDHVPSTEVIREFQRCNAFLIPTLCVACSATGEEQELREYFAAKARPEQLPAEVRTNFLRSLGISKSISTVENCYSLVKELKAVGVDIVAGTDAVPKLPGTAIGLSLIQELWQYAHRCGLTPIEALRSATSVAARRYRFADRGRVAEGMRADLLLVDGDPSSEIEDLLRVVAVWKAGELAYEYSS